MPVCSYIPLNIEDLLKNIVFDIEIILLSAIMLIIFVVLKRYIFSSILSEKNNSNNVITFIKSIFYLYSIHKKIAKSKKPYWKHYESRYKFLDSVMNQFDNEIILYVVDEEQYNGLSNMQIIEILRDFENIKRRFVLDNVKWYSEGKFSEENTQKKIEIMKRYIYKNIVNMEKKYWSQYLNLDNFSSNKNTCKQCKKEILELRDWSYFYFIGRFEMLISFCEFVYSLPNLPEEQLMYIIMFFKKDYEENIQIIKNKIISKGVVSEDDFSLYSNVSKDKKDAERGPEDNNRKSDP